MDVSEMLWEYGDKLDLLGVVTVLQVADISDEDRVSLLREWCESVGREYQDWMGAAVVGPPIGTFGPGELGV